MKLKAVNNFINEMVEKLPKLTVIDARIIMQDQYETRFGIYNHMSRNDRPLASVAMFPCEDTVQNSVIYEDYEEFALKRYHDVWGLSVEEFLGLPQYKVRMMREIADAVAAKRNSILTDPPK